MTKKEFDASVEKELHDEIIFLYGYSKMCDLGVRLFKDELWIGHCKRFKRQMKEHIYNMRCFDLSRLQYK